MNDMVERVAKAIDEVQLWSRFNDWASDRVDGCPIEICRYGEDHEEEIIVVARFGGAISESEALHKTVSEERSRAAIEAMRSITDEMVRAGLASRWPALYKDQVFMEFDGPSMISETTKRVSDLKIQHAAMIDEALK